MGTCKSKLNNASTTKHHSDKDIVFCFVNNTNKNIPNHITQIIFIYYLIKDTWIYTIGRNANGQLASGDKEHITKLKAQNHQNKYIQNIYQSRFHTIYSDDGHKNIWVSGNNDSGQCAVNKNNYVGYDITNLIKIKSFINKNIKIKNIFTNLNALNTFWMDINNNIYANGYNALHQLGLSDDRDDKLEPIAIKCLKNVKDIQVSNSFTLVLDSNGQVYVSGCDEFGGHGFDAGQIIKEFTVHPSLKKHKIVKIKTGFHHSLFLSDTFNVFSCGCNEHGELGLGSTNNASIPTLIEYFDENNISIIDMYCGQCHNLVLDTNGKVYSFGDNRKGQCGNGTTNNILTPTIIKKFKNTEIKRIVTGIYHSYAMTCWDKHYLWGSNCYNECSITDYNQSVLKPHYINDKISKETNKMIKNVSLGFCSTIIIVY